MNYLTRVFVASALISMILAAPLPNIADSTHAVPSIVWSKTYSGNGVYEARSAIQTNDGGFLLVSAPPPYPNILESSTGFFYMLKTDSLGNQIWNRTYPGIMLGFGHHVIQTSEGDYVIAAGLQNMFLLLRTDQSGNSLWNMTYARKGNCAAMALVQTADGGFAIVGASDYNYQMTSGINYGAWLVKTDSFGNVHWNLTIDECKPTSIDQTADGGYVISDDRNFGLVKVSSSGDVEWSRSFGNQDKKAVFSVFQTNDGGYALGGWMWLRTDGGNPNYAIVKTDELGNEQWTQYYGVGTAWSMAKTADGGFALAGVKLVKADSSGKMQWEIGYPTGGGANCVFQTQNGDYAIAGYVSSKTGIEAWLAKITDNFPDISVSPSSTPSIAPPQTPTPAESTSEYPTQAATVEPSPSPNKTGDNFDALAIAAGLLVVVAFVGALVILAKRRERR